MTQWSGSSPGQQKHGASLEERFMSRTEVRDMGYKTPCLIWSNGAVDKDGYGRFYSSEQKKIVAAHRWAFEHWVKPLGTGEVPDHQCGIRACVEPTHLEATPHGENSRRGRKKVVENRVGCVNGHVGKQASTKTGYTICRECVSIANKKWRTKNFPSTKPPVQVTMVDVLGNFGNGKGE